MSTKSTIEHGKVGGVDFHLYGEIFEDNAVYLELNGKIEYDAGPGHINIRLPLSLWEIVRIHTHHIFQHQYAGKTDTELRAIVQKSVDKRIKEYKSGNKLLGSIGIFSLGQVTDPRNKQIERGLKDAMETRDQIAAIQKQIADFYKKKEADMAYRKSGD